MTDLLLTFTLGVGVGFAACLSLIVVLLAWPRRIERTSND